MNAFKRDLERERFLRLGRAVVWAADGPVALVEADGRPSCPHCRGGTCLTPVTCGVPTRG